MSHLICSGKNSNEIVDFCLVKENREISIILKEFALVSLLFICNKFTLSKHFKRWHNIINSTSWFVLMLNVYKKTNIFSITQKKKTLNFRVKIFLKFFIFISNHIVLLYSDTTQPWSLGHKMKTLFAINLNFICECLLMQVA